MVKAEQLRARIADAIERLPVPTPHFNIEIGWAQDYEDLFAGHFSSINDIFNLVEIALVKGHVLLTGRGGGAKTVIVYRLAKYALNKKMLPVVVTLKDWTGRDYEKWDEAESPYSKISLLLHRFGIVQLRPLDLDAVTHTTTRLLLVDGLNEVNSRAGQEIIYSLEDFVRFAPNSRVVVTDRLVRRSFVNPGRWQLALARPLSTEEIERRVSAKTFATLSNGAKALLSSPYFLNQFLKDGQIARTRSEEFRTYFLTHGKLTDDELNLAARAALNAYASSSRTFSITDFARVVGDTVINKLEDSLIRETGGLAYFDHHLKHDYLVSFHMARHRDEWNSETFRVVTFGASSFETIALTLEQIDNTDAADYFLGAVYDWNPYGAGYSIAEARQTAASTEMQTVILAMLAERRLDIMMRTAERAADTLNLMRNDAAQPYQAAVTLDDIFALLRQFDSHSLWFHEWRELFTRTPDTDALEADLAHLTEGNSVNGWTASNVLKRLRLNARQQATVREWIRVHQNHVVRWRAAHVLGAFPNQMNVDALLAALRDDAVSVRFGCTRSLIELAARDGNLTEAVFTGLRQDSDLIAGHQSVVDEVQRALFVRPDIVPRHWTASALPLIEILQSKTRSAYKAEQWDRVIKELVTTYGI